LIAPGSTIVGRYRVETTLAEGSFGVVYAAHDVEEGEWTPGRWLARQSAE
jgi:hypothetical protein